MTAPLDAARAPGSAVPRLVRIHYAGYVRSGAVRFNVVGEARCASSADEPARALIADGRSLSYAPTLGGCRG